MKVVLFFSVFICLVVTHANGQEEEFTVKGNIDYTGSIGPVKVRLICIGRGSATTYTDSLGNYSLTKIISLDERSLECVLLITPPDYKRCGRCPCILREDTVFSEKRRRIYVPMVDSILPLRIIDATINSKMLDDNIPASIFFTKNSSLFLNYFSSDTLLDCVADYLLNCDGCTMEIAGYSDSKETDKQLLSEQRAEKVYNLLLKRGVNENVIRFKGYSYADSAETSASKDGEKAKGRVDFLLKKKS